MGRRNIFEILSGELNIKDTINKIIALSREESIIGYSLEDFVDMYCFFDWKARGTCINCDEMKRSLEIMPKQLLDNMSEEFVLRYLEYLANIINLCNTTCPQELADCEKEYLYLIENVESLIEYFGYEQKEFVDEEKVFLVEKNSAASAVVEIVESDIAYDVIEYNHYLMKGDIKGKQKILKVLADKFESMRSNISSINKNLESNTGFLLNNMNIRHNNLEGTKEIHYVKSLSSEQLEEWYDETYQMLLLCFLENDNIERNRKVDELKREIGR